MDEPWRALLPRIRYKDLGPGATFGARDVAKVEGLEVCCSRPSDGGPPVVELAAVLLHLIGVTPETPTWEIKRLLEESGLGPPYGRGDHEAAANLYRRARAALGEDQA